MTTPDSTAARPFVYVVIRVPKSGSTSLSNMVRDALPDARSFDMPTDAAAHAGYPLSDRWRLARRRLRHLRRHFGTWSMADAWAQVARQARAGDIVTGHIRHGDAVLPGFTQLPITLVRDPVGRVLSQYNYSRQGFAKRNPVQRFLNRGVLMAAARYDFSGFLAYLDEHRAAYGNATARYVLGAARADDVAGFIRANYFHIGTLERLEGFRAGLGRKLGRPVAERRDNVTERVDATALAAADRPVFERVFGQDMAIWEAVRRIEAEEA